MDFENFRLQRFYFSSSGWVRLADTSHSHCTRSQKINGHWKFLVWFADASHTTHCAVGPMTPISELSVVPNALLQQSTSISRRWIEQSDVIELYSLHSAATLPQTHCPRGITAVSGLWAGVHMFEVWIKSTNTKIIWRQKIGNLALKYL